MSNSLNKCTFIGNLGADPEIRSLNNGNRVAGLRLAVSESWKDKNSGQKREKTEWVNVSIFGEGLVGVAEKYLRKGAKVYIEGAWQTRKWQDKDGNDRYSTEIVLQGYGGTLIMLDNKSSGGAVESAGGYNSNSQAPSSQGESFDLDDDVPFS